MTDRIDHIQTMAAYAGTSIQIPPVPAPTPVVEAAAEAEQPARVVRVSARMGGLFRRIGLVPPDEGKFDVGDLDRLFAEKGLDLETRLEAKAELRSCGLLTLNGR